MKWTIFLFNFSLNPRFFVYNSLELIDAMDAMDAMADNHIASLIIIGDEVLKGQVQDAHTMYLARSLQTKGIRIRKVVIIPDEVNVSLIKNQKNFLTGQGHFYLHCRLAIS